MKATAAAFTIVVRVESTGSGTAAPIVVVSNRGPVAFKYDSDGKLTPGRGGGGLVTCLAPAVAGADATWIATAMTDGDREAADRGIIESGGFRLRQLVIEPNSYRRYYDVIANGTLWFLHHNLFDLARRPRIDSHWWDAWHSYCEVNLLFADAVAESAPHGATVLIHDYHLTLLGKALRESRPDLKTVHFHHTPFVGRNTIDVLPPTALRTLLEGLAGHNACGFHSQRWADNFALCCQDELGYVPNTFVSAAAPDQSDLKEIANSQACADAKERVNEIAGDRKLIVRVDRIELSKNLVRGFHAYDDFLQRYPRWREKVTFAAFIYPSREGMAEYLAYRNEVQGTVDYINERMATPSWQPIVLHTEDNFPQSIAALHRYDVLLINPIRDGLNLVAKEGAMLNEREGAIVLSREAGSWQELSDAAIGINPFDITETGDALLHALEMNDEERAARARRLRESATKRTPFDWLDDQLRAATS